jgi:PAS domain S-box-containing protein
MEQFGSDAIVEETSKPNESKFSRKEQNSVVSRMTLILLQILIGISIYLLFKNFILARGNNYESPVLVSILCAAIAPLCAYLILVKYQGMIRYFSMENLQLGEKLGERNIELIRANEEMRLEITQRMLIEQALGESEGRFRAIFRESAIGIALLDGEGRFLECNPMLQELLGYSLEELRGMRFHEISHPQEVESGKKYFGEILKNGKGISHVEKRYIRKNGRERWCSQSLSLVRNSSGYLKFLIVMIEDITKRREVEAKIRNYQKQLQRLATELSLTEERERRSLATCLHDHIGQALALAKIKVVDMLDMQTGGGLASHLRETKSLIEQSIRSTKSVVFELSPPTLYDLGFEATVEWLAEQMKQDHGLLVKVISDEHPKPIDLEIGVVLFRAVRELLLNVVKHAKATTASVTISRVGKKLHIVVEDNGKGFLPDSDKNNKNNGYGIFSIRERVEYLEGKLRIESQKNQGTRVMLEIPMKLAKNQRITGHKAKDSAQETMVHP